ncbi:MAG: DNA repair protein RecN [Vagococcus sp.]
MIQELSVQDFAIISNLNIEFKDGMTALTGETGAGKSIIIDAMGLLIGGRGSTDYIRKGAEKCRIEGSFYVKHQHRVYEYLEEIGIEMPDDVLILQREIYQSGRNNCRINGQLVNTKLLRELGQRLVDIHGQNEHQELMQASHHLKLLDQFHPEQIAPLLEEYRQTFHRYKELNKKVTDYQTNEKEYVQRIDMLTFQLEEIDSAQLNMGEEEQLMEERGKLMNYQKIADALKTVYGSIEGDGNQALDLVGLAMNEMETIEKLDTQYEETTDLIRTSYYSLQEVGGRVTSYLDSLEMDEGRLSEVETRLDAIRQLKRKYGETVDSILKYAESIKEELSMSTLKGVDIEDLKEELCQYEKKMNETATRLTKVRKETAAQLEKNILHQLKELYMENTEFEVMFEKLDMASEFGQDKVEFFISTNVGESMKPLVKVASGGELSRIMLALKTIFSRSQEITSIVFDEVDTGVSGRVAQAIAEKIHQVGRNSQVLCITHLPQVAAVADTQYFIEKRIQRDRTETTVRELKSSERIDEIARMLSGSEVTPLTIEHARELLSLAQDKK